MHPVVSCSRREVPEGGRLQMPSSEEELEKLSTAELKARGSHRTEPQKCCAMESECRWEGWKKLCKTGGECSVTSLGIWLVRSCGSDLRSSYCGYG